MPIKLYSDFYLITKIKKKTKAKGFKDWQEGDYIQFELTLAHKGGANSEIRATYVTATNISQEGHRITKSQSELINLLSRVFELEKIGGEL